MEQAAESVLACHFANQRHQQHVVVYGQIAFLVYRSQFKLVGSHFVVACLAGYAKLKSLYFQVFHECGHAAWYGTEVVVVHLLVFGRIVAHQRASRQHKVGAGGIEAFVHQEVLLFPAQVGVNMFRVGIEILAHCCRCLVYCRKRFLERSLIVQGLACVGDEHRWNHQRIVDDKYGRRRVPGRIATRFESAADSAAGERRGIGLLLYKFFTGKLLDHAALEVMFNECVMLFSRSFRKRLEPVGAVGHSVVHCPLFHSFCHLVGYRKIQECTVYDDIAQFFIYIERQILEHLLLIEDIFAEKLAGTLCWSFNFQCFLLESFFYDFEP